MADAAVVLFNGISYGMLLFIITVGLSVTMGMMRFINLAHATFAMVGGYTLISFFYWLGVPYFASLALAFIVTALVSAILERVLFQWFYGTDDLPQVLLTLGIIFMSIATVSYFWGPAFQPVPTPGWLTGRVTILGFNVESYRVFLFVIGIAIAALMIGGLEYTRFGAMVRACVDNQRAASGSGLNPKLVFAVTFAIGGGLAGLGGALSAGILGLDPNYPLRYLVYILIILSLGGMGTISGTLLAAILIGIVDVAGKYYLPSFGGFMVYIVAVIIMFARPQGLLGRAGG
ncbi:MAG: branched-chain amino acid ABC transporter permease [Stellaceae bacterium]